MTEYLTVDGGTLAYEVSGASGPLVVLAHGMGDSRAAYRFVVPRLVAAGYRVAAVDLRGCGESSARWPSYSRTDIAGDLLAVIRHLGGPAVLVGHSISGGAATIAAAQAPEMITGIVELAPFTRKQSIRLGDLRVARYRKGMARLLGTGLLGSVPLWRSYLDIAYPGRKPADWTARTARIDAMMREPGRMAAMRRMGQSAPVDAGAQLGNVRCPALIVEGTLDPDWADPRAEGEAIVAALPAGLGQLEVIEGAGHYPHVQYPDETVTLLLAFLGAHVRA
ncbi:alpha/beta fold hydrolase [Micromonospora lupini]|uniref:Putative hydrolase n=1 Tax=Micromonospora lupini str. Lupac 08 TaxID=1150864 RepID=I0KZT8_9ACTN|nr:alpha/beta hydrolase [Micromonospora lupini]CCH17085.1 putative hydrolase [Micromonospora lupini str. Lupac 08]